MKTHPNVGPATGVAIALVSGDDGNDRLGLFADLSQLLQSSLIHDGGAGFDLMLRQPERPDDEL